MNHEDSNRIDVLASIKRISIADNVFGERSRKKLQDIINQKDIWCFFEKIPKELNNLIENSSLRDKVNYTNEYIQEIIMDDIILSILKEAITQAVKSGIGQLTDELIADAIDRRIVWGTIVQTETRLKKTTNNGRII